MVLFLGMVMGLYLVDGTNDLLGATRTSKGTVSVPLPEDPTVDDVAQALYDVGAIENVDFFKLYCKVTSNEDYFSGGVYEIDGSLDYEGLISALQSQQNLETVTITFPEGYSVRQIAELLEENKVCSADDVLKACQSDDFEEYDIVAEIENEDGSKTFKMTIADDLVWSDGTPITAHDFEYSWKQIFHRDEAGKVYILFDGIQGYDAFIALTSSDESNVLSCVVAKKFGVARTVAEVENMEYIKLAEEMGVDNVINKKLLTAGRIFRLTLSGKARFVHYMTGTNAEVIEYTVVPGSAITKGPIKDIDFPENAIIGGVIRRNEAIIAVGDTVIEAYDRVAVFALPQSIREIDKFFR